MVFTPTLDKPSRAAATNPRDRIVRSGRVISGAAIDLLRTWRRARDDRAALRHVDAKDIGYPAEFPSRADMMELGAFAKYALLAVASLIGALTLAWLQQSLLPGLRASDLVPAATFGAILIGSVASGLAGFAFSAITGSLLLHWLAPGSAVPLLLACSILTQICSILALRHTLEWRQCGLLLLGGLLGIPVGAYALQFLAPAAFAAAFGAFLVAYSVYMLARPNFAIRRDGGGGVAAVAVGFCGGITGGAAAFPGAVPTIWCSLRRLPKDAQRGTVQPFILVMQLATLGYFSKLGLLGAATAETFLWCAPAVLLGTWIGLRLFRRIDDVMFRRTLLAFLLVSGAALMW
jgi:uncharacterized protein